MRFFIVLAYHGAAYSGWQSQPNAPSVQAALEDCLSVLLRRPTAVVGCGRTDAGVHARYYVAHFDAEAELPERFLSSVNGLLPPDIAVMRVGRVADEAHARYDAVERDYHYEIDFVKNPFGADRAWFFPQHTRLDFDALHEAARLLTDYEAFAPFCKTDSGADHYRCKLFEARWTLRDASDPTPGMQFYISANRFLRGMVRLIVGACIETALGKMRPDDIRRALETQSPLPRNLSVPPQGLALTSVRYPFDW